MKEGFGFDNNTILSGKISYLPIEWYENLQLLMTGKSETLERLGS
jgi:hypothetical protein